MPDAIDKVERAAGLLGSLWAGWDRWRRWRKERAAWLVKQRELATEQGLRRILDAARCTYKFPDGVRCIRVTNHEMSRLTPSGHTR